jgi:hypothetical protein
MKTRVDKGTVYEVVWDMSVNTVCTLETGRSAYKVLGGDH